MELLPKKIQKPVFPKEEDISEPILLASRAELIAELRRRDRELKLLHQIRTALLSNPDVNEAFQTVVENIAGAFGFALVSLFLIEDNILKLKAHVGYENNYLEIPLDKGVNGRVATNAQAAFIPDVNLDPDYMEAEPGVASQICVPLLNRMGEAIGTLSVESYQARPLDERDYNLSLALAEHIMLAIEQSRLYMIEQRRAKQLMLINQVGRELAASLDVQEIIDKVTGPVRRSLGYYAVSIGLLDEERNQLIYRITDATQDESKFFLDLNENNLSSYAALHNEMVLVQDVSQDSRYKPAAATPDTRAEVVIPLRSAKKVVGVLNVKSNRVEAFDDDDVILLKTLADQTSVALANAQRFESVERQKSELAHTNRALAEANRLKNEFLANVSHELRTPLNSIMGYVDMIQSEYYGKVPDEFKDPLERVARNSNRLLVMINDVLDLAKLEAGRDQLMIEQFVLAEVVRFHCDPMADLARQQGLTFDLEIDPAAPRLVYNDAQRLGQILSKLLSNAIKFTQQGGVTVRVRNYQSSEWENPGYALEVSDTGIGIPTEEYEHIFEAFRQVDGSTTRTFGGAGMGLAICLKLVRMMNGQIKVCSTVGEGSTFSVILPNHLPN